MAKREISKDDLVGFTATTRIFGEHGRGVNKSIDAVVDPVTKRVWFEYSSNRVAIYKGPSLDEAIALYNAE